MREDERGEVWDDLFRVKRPGTWVKLNAWELFVGFFMLIWGILFDEDLDRQDFTRIQFFKHGIQDLITYEVFVYD